MSIVLSVVFYGIMISLNPTLLPVLCPCFKPCHLSSFTLMGPHSDANNYTLHCNKIKSLLLTTDPGGGGEGGSAIYGLYRYVPL